MRWEPGGREGGRSRCDDDARDSVEDCSNVAEDCERAVLDRYVSETCVILKSRNSNEDGCNVAGIVNTEHASLIKFDSM